MFFLQNSENAFRKFKSIFNKYESLSGQLVSYEKSEIVFTRNTPHDDKACFLDILGVKEVQGHSKYLGLPTLIGRNRSHAFNDLIERVGNKIKSWKASLLSMGGKEVLIKAVLQALPLFSFGIYKVPDKVTSKIMSLIQNFWWSSNGESRGVHWVRKMEMIKKKEDGGMGFKDLKFLNMAMLAKQSWRIVKYPELLVAKIMKAKYFPNTNPFEARLGYRPSYGWRSLMEGMNLLRGGCQWDQNVRSFVWSHDSSKSYTVKSGYQLAIQQNLERQNHEGSSSMMNINKFWRAVWRSNLPRKIKIFCWRLYHRGLPAGENLRRLDSYCDTSCRTCSFRNESILHALIKCWWSKKLWRSLNLDWVQQWPRWNDDPADWIYFCEKRASREEFNLILISAWFAWYNRNLIWHGKKGLTIDAAVIKIKALSKSYKSYNFWNCKIVQDRSIVWTPPKLNEVKFNCDGAYSSATGAASAGFISRDHEGSILSIYGSKLSLCVSPFDAEGRALNLAMKAAQEMHLEEVVFEVDSAELVDAILTGNSGIVKGESINFPWLNECRLMFMEMDRWNIRLIVREANDRADFLAKKALHSDWRWVELSAIPRLPWDCFDC